MRCSTPVVETSVEVGSIGSIGLIGLIGHTGCGLRVAGMYDSIRLVVSIGSICWITENAILS
mgnify:CR=1